MAPRRGGGGSSSSSNGGGSSEPVCPGFLAGDRETLIGLATPIEYYVCYGLFLFFFLCVALSLCCVRRKLKHKRLTGPLFVFSVSCQVLGYLLLVLAITLLECSQLRYYRDYFRFQIAFSLFMRIGNYILLVLVVWGVNTLLAQRLNSGQSVVKVVTFAITGVMGALTVAYIGLNCYISWVNTEEGRESIESDDAFEKYYELILSYQKYAVAYLVLYMLSVIAAGGLAIATITRMRSRNILVGDILAWTVALFLFMLLYIIFRLIPFTDALDNNRDIQPVTNVALEYLSSFFQLFAYIALIFLSKSRAWEHADAAFQTGNTGYGAPAYAPVQPQLQQEYVLNGQPGQPYYYQQQPLHNGAVNSNGHMVQVK